MPKRVSVRSSIVRAVPTSALARLRALRSDLIDPIISVHHGRVVKRTGDGSIIEFRRRFAVKRPRRLTGPQLPRD